jgi:hypothetical protein
MEEKKLSSERKFPPFYEKAIPITIAILVVIVAGLFVYSMGVALGWFTF